MDNFGALIILFAFIIGISILGAIPGLKDRKMSAENWAVGGRNFGRWLNWFIMCGEVYTAFAFLGASGWAYARGALPSISWLMAVWHISSVTTYCPVSVRSAIVIN